MVISVPTNYACMGHMRYDLVGRKEMMAYSIDPLGFYTH